MTCTCSIVPSLETTACITTSPCIRVSLARMGYTGGGADRTLAAMTPEETLMGSDVSDVSSESADVRAECVGWLGWGDASATVVEG